MMKNQTFIDKIQTENLWVKNPNSWDKIQHYGNLPLCSPPTFEVIQIVDGS